MSSALFIEQSILAEAWEEKNGSRWLTVACSDLHERAARLVAGGARFITITAQQLPEHQGVRLDYHWDLQGTLLTVVTTTEDQKVPTIRDLCEACDWIEREVHEFFAIDFIGHDYEPLLLRAGAAPGMNLRKEEDEE